MGLPVCTLGSISAGACGCAPIIAVSPGCPTVLVNGRPIMNIGKFWNNHGGSDYCAHGEITAVGSPTVFAGGLPVVRIGDTMTNGDMGALGSPNVLCG